MGLSRLNNLRVRTRLLAAAGLVCLLFGVSTAVVAVSFSGSSSLAKRAEHAMAVSRMVRKSYMEWLTADDNTNMYAALLALKDPALNSLAKASNQQAQAAYQAAVNDLTKAQALATRPQETAALTQLSQDLPTYNGFSQTMRQDVARGQMVAGIRQITVANSAVSTDLTNEFNKLDSLETAFVNTEQSGVVSSANSGLLLSLIIAGVAIVAILAALGWVIRSIVRPLAEAVRALRASSEGDLRARAAIDTSDELGEMAKALNVQLDGTQALLKRMSEVSSSLAAASSELTSVSTQLASGSEETAAQAQTVSAAAEQVSANVGSVAAAAEELSASIAEISRSATGASDVASRGVRVAQSTSNTVSQLSESSARVGEVVRLITSIAEQTNLLALNATIEAARAGEAGRGFAIVANEVKELAKQTAGATEDIARTIEEIQGGSQAAVEAIGQMDEIMSQVNSAQTTIASAVEQQTATTSEIGRTVQEAAVGSGEIAANIAGVATAAQQTTQGAASTLQAAGELSKMAEELTAVIAGYKF